MPKSYATCTPAAVVFLAVAITAPAVAAPADAAVEVKPLTGEQAEAYGLDTAFYKKGALAQGILIATSDKVSDYALLETAYQFEMILGHIDPQVARRVRDRKPLCLLIGCKELTSDLPQFASDKTGKDLDFYNWRQRGFLHWQDGRPIVVFAEEDVLQYEGGMQLESILIHEFGHVVHGAGFDEALQKRLTETFKQARAKGLWNDGRAAQRFRRVKSETPVSLFEALVKAFPDESPDLIRKCLDGGDILVNGEPTHAGVAVTGRDKVLIVFGGPKQCYAGKNRSEYWAEGFQCWYDTNRTMDHDHNHIHTRDQLKAYDPGLAALCRDVLRDSAWRFVSPRERAGTGHLAGYDPAAAPKAEQPEHIQEAALDYYDRYWKDFWQRLRDKYATARAASGYACDLAEPATRPDGAPRYGDVSMRLFVKRDGRELAAAKAFHITRADWSYIKDAEYIERCHDLGWTFQGSTNAVTHDPAHALKDAAGNPVLDHFGKPGRYWADCTSPAYRDWYVEQLKGWVEAGVDSIQRDEPTAIRHWDYDDAAAFFRDVHARLREAVGRRVPRSCNLAWNDHRRFGGRGEAITSQFDFGMSELGRRDVSPRFLTEAARDTRRRGKVIVYTTFHALGVPTYRRAIAGCYANGMLFIVPWDQYAGTKADRVFSRPQDLADLYGFVRANAGFLDGYEAVGVAGDAAGGPRLVEVAEASGLTAWVRARPGDQAAPVVVHLVDWDEPAEARIRLNAQGLFAGKPLAVELRTPAPYDAAAHERAESDGCYDALSTARMLPTEPADGWAAVEVPPLAPWGMLLVRPAAAAAQ
jgi:hypothetical protein